VALSVIDDLLLAKGLPPRTGLRKIAAPEGLAPTSALTINPVAAVVLPAALGRLRISARSEVLFPAAGNARIFFTLGHLVPPPQVAGHEPGCKAAACSAHPRHDPAPAQIALLRIPPPEAPACHRSARKSHLTRVGRAAGGQVWRQGGLRPAAA